MASDSGNTSKLDVKKLLEFQPCLLITDSHLIPKEKLSLLAINFNQSPEKTYQMCPDSGGKHLYPSYTLYLIECQWDPKPTV